MKSVNIGYKDNNKISLAVIKYERPLSDNSDDNSWLTSQVTINVGMFSGQFSAQLQSHDFIYFRDALKKLFNTLIGQAKFETIEGQIEIIFMGNGRGGISVTGCAMDSPGCGNSLDFNFNIDQSYIPNIICELDEIISMFSGRMA